MSKRVEEVYVRDMLSYAKKVQALASRLTRAAFDADEEHQAAICHWLQTVGEAATRLPKEFRESHPDIAWKDIIGMRNILVHRYTGVDLSKVWKAANTEIAKLIPALEAILSR